MTDRPIIQLEPTTAPFVVGPASPTAEQPVRWTLGAGGRDQSSGAKHDDTECVTGPVVDRRRQVVDKSAPRHKFSWERPAARQLLAQIQRVATVNSTLLLLGESGTGKSTIARMVHQRSARSDRPFVVVNCASLPAELIDAELFGHARGAFTGAVADRMGRVQAAAGGTLFLDEIGDLPLELQPKLLTFLQDRTFYRLGSNELVSVDVRVISATNTDLLELSKAGRFRRDLFFRLAVLTITVPTLAERRDEIGEMARSILRRIQNQDHVQALQLSSDALAKLKSYDWPGNIRELENVLESAATFCESCTIEAADLLFSSHGSDWLRPSGEADVPTDFLRGKTLAELEREAIITTLNECDGNKTQTAKLLGISLRSIYNKMQKHGLEVTKTLNTES